MKNFDVCSADTLLRMQKELATEKETVVSETNIWHNFNINIAMNRLMIKLLVQTGQLLPAHEGYIFDYDNANRLKDNGKAMLNPEIQLTDY